MDCCMGLGAACCGRRKGFGGSPSTRALGRKRGGFMGRAGIDLFIEDGAYTTLSSAVVILAVLTLLFSSTAAIWSMSRAGDTQVAADSGALAGANVVSSYHTAATVVDASILSLGLAGFATIGTGLVAILIPGAEVVGSDIIDTGTQIIKTRNKFAKSAAKGLQKIETALPYLVAARAMQAVSAQDTDGVTYTGTALAVPRTSESDLLRSKDPKSRPMPLKMRRKIWSARPRSYKKHRRRRRRPKSVPG